LIAEISEQLPSHFNHEPVYRSVVSFSSCGILPLLGCEREIEFDLALAVLRYLGVVLPAADVHRFIQNPTIEKIMDRGLFTDFFLVEFCRREGTRLSRAELEKSRVQREAGSSSQGYVAAIPGLEKNSKPSNAQRTKASPNASIGVMSIRRE
jgi:hypothetical protein